MADGNPRRQVTRSTTSYANNGNAVMTTKKQPVSYPFRAPLELRERLKRSAEDNNRSLNAEIIERLEASFAEGEQSALEIENNGMLKALCAKLDIQTER